MLSYEAVIWWHIVMPLLSDNMQQMSSHKLVKNSVSIDIILQVAK
jgi:hypothetical protein